jgi:uncharacterized protein (TIGR00251 family)
MKFVRENSQGLILTIFVQPRSSKNKIAGVYNDALKIKLTAAPVGGAANRMCLKYLSKCLKVPKSSLKIISGESARTKRVLYQYQNSKDHEAERRKIINALESFFSPKTT